MSATTASKAQRRALAIDRVSEACFYITQTEALALVGNWVAECKRTRNGKGDALLAARLRTLAKGYRERPWLLNDGAHIDVALCLGEAIGLLA